MRLTEERAPWAPVSFSDPSLGVYVTRPVPTLIHQAIAAQWRAAGHLVVEQDQDVTVTGRIIELTTRVPPGGLLRFQRKDAGCVLEVMVEIHVEATGRMMGPRQYRSEVNRFASGWRRDSNSDVGKAAVTACLQDLMRQIASDAEVVRFLSDQPAGAATAS